MTNLRFYAANICFLLLLFGFKMQAQEVEISLVKTEKISAKPGKITTVVASIVNTTDTKLRVRHHLQYPEGWTSIIAAETFEIAANSSLTKLISFLTPNQTTPSKDYEFEYSIEQDSSKKILNSLSFLVKVEEVINISIQPVDAPNFVVAGEDISAKFLVRNSGNVEQQIFLSAYNCDLKGEEILLLSPNSVQIVEVLSSTSTKLKKVSRKSFRLEGRTTADETVSQAHAYQHSQIIPNSDTEINDIRRLPSYLQLSYLGSNNSSGEYISGWQGELFARGKLDKSGEKELEVRLRGPSQLNTSTLGAYDEYYAKLTTANFDLHLGDKTYSLSPLTEYARNGRGVETSIRQKKFEFGGFYHRPRFFPKITSELGAYAKHHFSSNNSISLNFLQKEFAETNNWASLYSVLGRVSPLKNTFLEAEFSQGFYEQQNGFGGYLKLETSPIKQLNISSTVLYASQNFPGYFTNTWYYTGSVNYAITSKINAFVNIYQDENNAARDTLFSTAPLSKRYQGGLNFRLTKKTQIKGYVRQSEMKDLLPSFKFHNKINAVKLQVNQKIKDFQLSSAIEYGRTENFLNSENLRFAKLLRAYFDINYRVSHRHNIRGFVQFFENNTFDKLNQQQILFGVSGYSKITKSTQINLQYQNNFALEDYYRDRNLFEFRLIQRIKKQHEISIASRYALQRQTIEVNQGDFSVAVQYKYDFGIPLEGKENLHDLLGQIFNAGTESVKGIVLHLNGQTSVTDAQGNFKFKSLMPGKYYLTIDKSTLSLRQISEIPTPIEVEMKEGEDKQLSFGLTTSVTISGNLDLVPKKILTSNNGIQKNELPGPILLELSNGEEILRQVSEPDGTFIFSGLRPGKWNLKVIANGLFKQFIFEKDGFELFLKPGEKKNIEIKIKKKERKIRFLQSLSLTSN